MPNYQIDSNSYKPIDSLDDKQNYKVVYRIEKDGSTIKRVFLDVHDKEHREKLIFLHYLRHITRFFIKEEVGVNVLARDEPWDFKCELSNGLNFNVEITSIADNYQQFEINKREEKFSKYRNNPTIQLNQLVKLNYLFPDSQIEDVINFYKKQGKTKRDHVKNPIFNNSLSIFLSRLPEPTDTLINLIQSIISKKMDKNHFDKDKTVLIIDNRTGAFEVSDYFNALNSLESFINSSPFQEIWFYTGYYSDNDGNNAEFSFSPLKISNEQSKILEGLVNEDNVDENGLLIW